MFTMDFYAYWNAEHVAQLLRAVAGITSSSGYKTFLSAAALLGFIIAVSSAALKNRGSDIVAWFFAVVLLYLALFAPKVNVTVQDPRTASAQTVQGLPLGVGFTAALSSQIGHWAAELFETALTDVESQRFTAFGAVFPERAAAALAAAGPATPETRALLDPWIERCIVPEILESEGKLTELIESPNLTATVFASGWTNPSRFVIYEGKPLHCPQAGETLLALLRTVEVPAQEKLLMHKLSAASGLTASGSAQLEAALKKAVPEGAALMLGVSQSLSESLSHALLMTEIPAGLTRTPSIQENPLAAAVTLAKAQGNLASEISYRTMSELAKSFLPKLRNLLEFILIAAFPLVLGMLVACGSAAGAALRMYATLFLWLALWAPIASVVNYLLIHVDKEPLNRLAAHYGGLTMEAASLIRDQGATSQAMAGCLMLLVPLVSYLIAKASDMGAVSLASSILSPASSAAQSQSAQIALGNVNSGNASLGNVSTNNVSANKSDASTSFASGSITRTSTAAGTVVRDSSTGEVTSITAASSDLGVSSSGTLAQGSLYGSQSTVTTGVSSSSGATQASQSFERSESGTSGVFTQNASNVSSTANLKGESLLKSSRESSGIQRNSSAQLSESSSLRESFGLQSGVGVQPGFNSSAWDGTNPSKDSALLSGSPRLSRDASGAQGEDFADASSGFFNAAPTAMQASSSKGSPKASAPSGARLSGGAEVRTLTASQRDHGSSSTESTNQSKNIETSDASESRSSFAQETRGTIGSSASISEQQSAAAGTSASSSRSSGREWRSAQAATQRSEESTSLQHAAAARMDTYLTRAAIESFGSPEDALEALRNPAERAQFARDVFSGAQSQTAPLRVSRAASSATLQERPAAAGGSSEPMVAPLNSASDSAPSGEFSSSHSQAASRAEDFGESAFARVRRDAPRSPDFADRAQLRAQQLEAAQAERGALIAAGAIWENREVSASGTLSTALLAGAVYSSPSEVFEGLSRAADESPAVRASLAQIGRSGKADPEDLSRLEKAL